MINFLTQDVGGMPLWLNWLLGGAALLWIVNAVVLGLLTYREPIQPAFKEGPIQPVFKEGAD